jgi:hypothetical protein
MLLKCISLRDAFFPPATHTNACKAINFALNIMRQPFFFFFCTAIIFNFTFDILQFVPSHKLYDLSKVFFDKRKHFDYAIKKHAQRIFVVYETQGEANAFQQLSSNLCDTFMNLYT